MTDKQIIIDGVDVSGCLFYQTNFEEDYDVKIKHYCSNWHNSCESNNNSNCYYKQLKRKEQEYEELRKYHNKCCEEFEKEKKEWLEKYNQVSRDFHNGKYCDKEKCNLLKAKEQECEELKKIINEAKNSKLDLKSFLVGEAIQNEYEQQLDQLKAENDNIKETFDSLFKVQYKLADNNKKLRQCLIEIKEIAEKCCIMQAILDCENYDDCTQCGRTSDGEGIQQILQKISEVEDG